MAWPLKGKILAPYGAAAGGQNDEGIAAVDAKAGDPGAKGHKWNFYGPVQEGIQPGVTSFSGATNETASRVTALVVAPDCGQGDMPV